jgi:hypothetical protein
MDPIEGHPIPQDITGFQFKIFGDMTIKQLAYLAAGLFIAWLFISIPMSLFIKIPLAILFAGTGAIFAFVPIQGRAADAMLLLFLKAVINPNEYTYDNHAQTVPPTQIPSPTDKKIDSEPEQQAPLHIAHEQLKQPLEHILLTQPNELTPEKKEEKEKEEPAREKGVTLEQQLQTALKEKQELEKQLLALQQQLLQPQQPGLQTHTKTPSDDSKKIAGTPSVSMDTPNLISGTIKDARGNVVPQILVEVTDKDNNPVRAFKTNEQGQFMSATPLPNGTYTVSFEDPKKVHLFDTLTITTDGAVLQPLAIISFDEREKLRKSLFGG